ncbi:hypothetical protein R50072_07990 [Simiduia litorea]
MTWTTSRNTLATLKTSRKIAMTKPNNTDNKNLTEEAKQKTPLANEVDPKDAFTKAHAIAGRLSKQLAKERN